MASVPTPSSNSNERHPRTDEVIRQVADLLNQGQPGKALELLRHQERNSRIINALGVCLLRENRPEDALKYFRELVISPGSTWPRSDASDALKLNYATALLLCGHPAGCRTALSTVSASHPRVAQLRGAIDAWARSLPFLKKLFWKLGEMEPEGCPVTLPFPAGDVE